MLLINTRPSDRAISLTQQLQAAQVAVLELPLLELHAIPYSDELLHLYQQLEQVQIIVVVSPTAVKIGMQYLQQAGVELSALGQGTVFSAVIMLLVGGVFMAIIHTIFALLGAVVAFFSAKLFAKEEAS